MYLGISAAFMVWDAIDLGFTISDLVRKQGSAAAKTLRYQASVRLYSFFFAAMI